MQDGGNVRWILDEETGLIDVLYVQSRQMIFDLDETKPFFFQADTTFSTNKGRN